MFRCCFRGSHVGFLGCCFFVVAIFIHQGIDLTRRLASLLLGKGTEGPITVLKVLVTTRSRDIFARCKILAALSIDGTET